MREIEYFVRTEDMLFGIRGDVGHLEEGGPREGFHQLEAEQAVLDKIGLALDKIDKEGIKPMEEVLAKENELIKRETKIPVEEFKNIIEKVLGSKNEA